MSKRKVWYRCLTHCEASFYSMETTQENFDRWMAQEAASNYHHKHDGWEASWPLEFALHEVEEGPELARFEVQREAEPVFYAAAISKATVEPK